VSVGALIVAALLLVANGFFVAVEFALVASSRTKLEPLAEGRRAGRYALEATTDLTVQLAGAQLGITMASLGLGYVAEPAIAHGLEDLLGLADLPEALTHTIAFVIGLSIVVFLHMVIGEMVPKNLALVAPERVMLLLAIPNHFYVRAFRPFLWLLNALANLGMKPFGIQPADELQMARTPEEFAALIEESHEEGYIAEFAHDLLTGALDFGRKQADAVMVPREQFVVVNRTDSVAEIERIVVETGHSRLPVIGRDLDDVLGFVHAKDLLTLPPGERDRPLPLPAIRRMVVVRTAWPLDSVLRVMRRARVHFAVVLDDRGRTAGIVTLEDLLEELVGDIVDETDREQPQGATP
jgi:CBS domain containing-hemolysin-like protein